MLSLYASRFERLFQRALHKMNRLTQRNLRQMVHIRLDDAGDTRITAGGLRIIHQDNRLAVMRHLNHARQQAM
ncbi:hypothetical protein D3C72_2517720 [compost metagenome]